MEAKNILWILNGCGMEAGSITGGPVRFHEISSRWAKTHPEMRQHLMTTRGGHTMLTGMGCELPHTRVRAALFAKHERLRATRLWSYVLSAFDAKRLVRRIEPPEIVITVSDYFCDIVPALEMKRQNRDCRWIAWVHHCELPPSKRPGNRAVNTLTWKMQDWSLRQIAREANVAWVYDTDAGDQVKARLHTFGMSPNNVRIMKCGINLHPITTTPDPGKTVDAVMVGVRPNKGRYDILPVWEEVLKQRPGTTLRLMGGISGREELVDAIKRKGLDDIISVFTAPEGFLPQAEYYAKLKEARVLFAPSHEEGWGMAVCEAMAAGLPVAAYDLPVYQRIYGSAFAAVPCFDHAAFATALVNLLENPQAYARLRDVGLTAAARCDWDGIAEDDFEAL